ncbi:hypothetical protein BO94DRAFT_616033 [Aspergillus sclerotioniger CBS 115572]|uniref:Uncharacterized protein n=1 Tax=Aspergillus sclerotioniger CBS 115572 TaxID=1450535 RepID=A0A317X3D4_9EURO|nr:hypothetical protein BO94DRAFT_616033 [Aspergillus sclerotioniger CBS 115572]PWY93144.1 hypothetical protein BO94DRAFT_616033 [Aspergillus sclerotioniger CBS 115572]
MGPAPSLTAMNERLEEPDQENAAFANAEAELNHHIGLLICYRMIRLSAIRHWTRWKKYQDLAPHEYVEYYPIRQELDLGEAFIDPETGAGLSTTDQDNEQLEPKRKLYFISHRWLDPVHPDPEGSQLTRIQQLPPRRPLAYNASSASNSGSSSSMTNDDPASEVLLFYDFSSLPQEPRTQDESETFKLGIMGLNDILSYMRVVILDDQEYMSRSWCLMEYFISSFKGSLILDENRNEGLHQLQQLAVVPNQGVGLAKSAIAEAEAIRGSKMGEIAMTFFAESFKSSSVTKGTDRQAIEDVFRSFIRDNIRVWRHEPHVGWKPAWLQDDQVDQILRGERMRLIDLPDTGMPVFRMPREIDSVVPQCAYDDEREALEPFWGRVLSLRGSNALARYFLLNDPVAQKEWDMVKKVNI